MFHVLWEHVMNDFLISGCKLQSYNSPIRKKNGKTKYNYKQNTNLNTSANTT